MLRLLILGSALTVLASACFRSPAVEETTEGTSSGGTSNGGTTASSTGRASSGSTSGSSGQCELPSPGSCSTDGDCVLALCSDDACNCGGWVIARSQLAENPCLIEEGTLPPAGCTPQGSECECPAHPLCTPRCSSGTCACDPSCGSSETLCNGTCVDTSGDLDNCGACGHPCGDGQLCLNGVCSSGGPRGGMTGEDAGSEDACTGTDFCTCTNFCVSTCRCGDGGCPLTQPCEGALCPNSCPDGEACSAQPGGAFLCSPTCTPSGVNAQGSCQAGMTCETVCT